MELWADEKPIDQPSHWGDVWEAADMARSVDALAAGQDPLASLIDRVIEGLAPGRGLDHGCGFGRVSAVMAERGWHMVGVDFAWDGLSHVRDFAADASALSADIRAMPFTSGSFDCSVSVGVVEHLREGPLAALTELRRVLRRGAPALVTVPYQNKVRSARDRLRPQGQRRHGYEIRALPGLPEPDAVPPGFYQYAFRPEEFVPWLTAAGFEVQSCVPHSVSHGLADTRPGAWAKDLLHQRFGLRAGQARTTQDRGRAATGTSLKAQLRAVYDEDARVPAARVVGKAAGPLFGHMAAYLVTAV